MSQNGSAWGGGTYGSSDGTQAPRGGNEAAWGGAAPAPSASPDRDERPAQLGAPVHWLVAAFALEVAGLLLGAFGRGRPVLSATGWVLGGLLAIGLLAIFTVQDTARRADAWYVDEAWPSTVRAVLSVLAVLAVALSSYQFADWASRR